MSSLFFTFSCLHFFSLFWPKLLCAIIINPNTRSNKVMFSLDKLIRICFVLAIANAIFLVSAHAATITVTNAGDVDGNDQACTLREAISSIHALTTIFTGCIHTGLYGIDDTIEFDPGLSNQVIRLDHVQDLALTITIDLVINGLGADQLTIDGAFNSPGGIFSIEERSINVEINNLTISRGRTTGSGGGIYAEGRLVLADCIVSRNTAGIGGGILAYNGSRVTLNNTIVSGNTASGSGGGIMVDSEASVIINNSLITENSSDEDGGGITVRSDSGLTVTGSTVSGNTAGTDGGGINISGDQFDEIRVLVRTSTISGNTAQEFGGGINGLTASIDLRASTISGNTANVGGGVFFVSNESDRFLTLRESTIVNNIANDDGGGIVLVGNITIAKFIGSIFSGNQAVDLADEIGNLGASIEADASNLFGDSLNSMADAFNGYTPDLLGTDIIASSDGPMPTALTSILVTTLKDNGGPTKTHALVAGSPAIDSGHGFCFSTDQRGVSRDDGECDIGSYEYLQLIFSDGFE